MAENQIPPRLIECIRTGRAALVVGSSIGALGGLPSWKKVLERLREEVERRGSSGDKEAAQDVAGLLKKGRLLQAVGFLARTLGSAKCDAVIAEAWKTPEPLPDALKILGRLPFAAIWTVHPGTLVPQAILAGSPDGWPVPQVASYEQAAEIVTRRRYVLKLLGDVSRPESYVVLPASVRRALSSATAYRAILQDLYRDGALLFIGFRHGDPDLHAILDRVFGAFEPPEVEHTFVGAGLSPVDIEELSAEHHMTVAPLAGQGGDDKSAESILAYLTALAEACGEAGLTLLSTRPTDDDLDGWKARLLENPADAEAQDALLAMEERARADGHPDRVVELLLSRAEVETDPKRRAAVLRQVANTFEKDLGDLPHAFTTLTAALRDNPADEETVLAAERLAAETDGWGELVSDLAAVVPHIEDRAVAAGHWVRLGRWYLEKLRHYDYAVASYREALKIDAKLMEAREGLEELYRRQQKWGELAEELTAHAEVEGQGAGRIDVLLSLGDLFETQLASTAKAIEAYEKVVLADATNDDALAALERLYRRGERWGKLAAILEKRAERADAVDAARAANYRRELASLRSEKLGDVEGAIGRYEAALDAHPRDLEALRALEKLYEKVGRTDDYLHTLERLAEVGPENERAVLWRRLAAEVEDREGGAARAIRYYENVLALEPGAVDAYRQLERLYRAEQSFEPIVRLYDRHIGAASAPAQRLELVHGLARIFEEDLNDPRRAIEAHVSALDLDKDNVPSLVALARLYRRIEAWDRAVETLTRLAARDGTAGADLWFQAGEIALGRLGDPTSAEHALEKALEMAPAHVAAMLALIEIYRKRQEWARAAQLALEAERHTQNRQEKLALLFEAASLNEEVLEAPEKARELYARILALDPEHLEAGRRLAEHWVAAQRWADAEPVLEMLARKVDPGDAVERARREALVARVAEALGHVDKAQRHYRLAVEADPESLDAAFGLAGLLYLNKEWAEAERHYREVLARHRPALDGAQVVDIWHRIGVAARQRGEQKVAEDAFRRALERDPDHRASLSAMVDLAEAAKDWTGAALAKRSLLSGASDDERFRLHEEIGDLHALRLADPNGAIDEYGRALALRPTSHVVLHKVLEIHTEQKNWPEAVETLTRLAADEGDPARRAKIHYTAAVIARDEVKDEGEALAHFQRALDDAPNLPKAFEAVERILTDRADWKGLARAYRKMIKRLGEHSPEGQLLALWTRLGDIAREKLGDSESAMAAYEVAVTLDPGNVERHEQLASLYLAAGPERADKAAAELQLLLRKFPDRLSIYRTLSRLYAETGQVDKAFCLASALVFLGQASDEERRRFEVARPKQLTLAKRRLTEELWQKAIIHPREDRALNGIFASLMASLAATTAQPHQALNLNPKDQTDLEKSPHAVAKIFRYAVSTLGLAQEPELYLREGSHGGIQTANVSEKGLLTQAVLIGEPYVAKKPEREVAFDVAKKLSFLRPERYVYYALPTLPKLQTALDATLRATGVVPGVANGSRGPAKVEAQGNGDVERLVTHLRKTVPSTVLEQVALLARKLTAKEGKAIVESWVTATDLTANRVGLILANDLEVSARVVATEQGVLSTLSAKDRLRELLLYSVSEEYFSVRKYLGFEVGG